MTEKFIPTVDDINDRYQVEPNWEAETYKRFLMLLGGSDDELDRAKSLLREFNHFFPAAKTKWDEYCASMGIRI